METVKFGVVLPSYCYNEERKKLASRAFETLERTVRPSSEPNLLLLLEPSDFQYPANESKWSLFGPFLVEKEVSPPARGTEQTLAYGTQKMFDLYPAVTHVVWMGDDALFSPLWLVKLEELISRHPQARSWSVYRSAYEAVHWVHATCPKTGDILVNSICGHGMTFDRAEWERWGIKWEERTRWDSNYGNTLDMHHAANFKGHRWVTPVSYVEHTGVCGVNCRPEIPEHAQFFQGTEVVDA